MEENRKRGSVRGQNDDLGDSTIEGLRSFVRTLLQLTIVLFRDLRVSILYLKRYGNKTSS